MEKIDELSIATIRSLCIDMINKANSGHPGMALGSAPLLYTLFKKHLKVYPEDAKWFNRDRFVLSSGHASSLLYVLLYLSGYNLSLNDLKQFRQLNSKTPGHPEYNFTDGVDATSGPLGQGIGQAVGIALAESILSSKYSGLVNHYTYCLCGDGCLQEGLSQEAVSFAGVNKLSKLILFYDSNNVTLDGPLSNSFNENVEMRFKACEWNVLRVENGNDVDEINQAIVNAKLSSDKPTLIIVNTIIGYGSALQGTNKVHGTPLSKEDVINTKKNVYHFDYPDFYVPEEVLASFKESIYIRGKKEYERYLLTLALYRISNPMEHDEFLQISNNEGNIYKTLSLPSSFDMSDISTRNASCRALNYFNKQLPNLVGGSADVAGSVMTKIENGVAYSSEHRDGNTINFGIREFAMGSIQNGMLLHGGLKTYVGAFMVFSDYMKPAIRMAALSHLPAIYLFSHDSIAVGEDGPTHQPIEQLIMLRSIPNVNVFRPADLKETFACWLLALQSKNTPSVISLSRQNLPVLENSNLELVKRGGYLVSKNFNDPDFLFIATGSEVSLCIEASKKLFEKGIKTNVISMPCLSLFDSQNDEYKNSVISLPKNRIISVEMGSEIGWDKYAEHHFSINSFGKSGKASDVLSDFGFVADILAKFIGNFK